MIIYRNLTDDVRNWLVKGDIIAIYGARQVGKTFLMKYLVKELLGRGEKVLFVDLEDFEMRELLTTPRDFLIFLREKGVKEKEKVYVFLDEVHYLQEPSNLLKVIHDHHPYIQLVVSGSSSFQIRRKFKDILTGRKQVFHLDSLSFEEYLRFKGLDDLEEIKKNLTIYALLDRKLESVSSFLHKRFVDNFEQFAIWGGYPRVALTEGRDDKVLILKEIYESYVQKDIKDFIKIESVPKFNSLVKFLSVQSGGLLNLQEISKEVGIARDTLENYLFILEQTFVIKRVQPYFTNRQKEITKMSKLFFRDTGLRNYSIKDLREIDLRQDKGTLLETAVHNEIDKRLHLLDELYFWRTQQKREVDFVLKRQGELIPIEVKYRNIVQPQIGSSLKSFIRSYNPETALILNKNFWGETLCNDTRVLFVPVYAV